MTVSKVSRLVKYMVVAYMVQAVLGLAAGLYIVVFYGDKADNVLRGVATKLEGMINASY